MAEAGFWAAGAEFQRRDWLAEGISVAAFVSARRYAAGCTADPYALLCPGVVTASPAQARQVEALGLAAPVPSCLLPELAALPEGQGDVLAELGRRRLGPVAAAYAHWVWDRLGPDLPIFGIMRDGGFLAQSLRAVRPQSADRVGTLWLPRRLCLTAAIASADDHEALLNLLVRSRGAPASLGEALDDLGLTETPPGFAAHELLEGERLTGFLHWLAGPARKAVQAHAAALRSAILAHLGAQGALDHPVLALADVGYAGSIQRALSRILAMAGSPVRPLGLYVLTSPGLVWALHDGARAHGFLAQLGAPAWCAH
ncbi:MAG: hypothetical protein K2X44_00750, partial [Magnetospirillum sp.]|nr:hypothetical protein [Magnetospirillum sp.]